ncbi:class I SAM-dependent RNA methyltransferase [Acidicapsa acidisoli]|uniref:class I SAM-dependent RNA methyltransferase n=1 Tax=Acidicapsa acidisoli TaxID=1615681 RepID=UPI0021E0B52C|nr:class I SAM-dependent RNA methyltransferase [Acidicapsa acidisoli]
MKPTLNLTHTLRMEKPIYGGECLARAESESKRGKTVFVPLTLPGETVTAHVTEERRSFAKAEVDQILTASVDRVQPKCPHFGSCGGCHYQHAGYPAQKNLKQQILRETLTRAGVALPPEIGLLSAEPWAYRNRIRLGLNSAQEFGYRGRRSHSIVPIRECPIAAPRLMEAAAQIARFLKDHPSPSPISEFELFTNHDQSQLLITLFSQKASQKEAPAWLDAVSAALSPHPTGLRIQYSDGSLNPQILAISGGSSLTYTAAGIDYRVDHGAFFQVNRWLIDDFTTLIAASHSGKLAWDLFAGVGLFARQLAQSFEEVLAIESAPASFPALEHNLQNTNSRSFGLSTLDFLRRNREEREPGPDLIVLDPPRTGLGEETTSLLNAIHAPVMVYVSCDPATLARDLHALTSERYKIDSIILVDMFPQTFHLETVVRLSRI